MIIIWIWITKLLTLIEPFQKRSIPPPGRKSTMPPPSLRTFLRRPPSGWWKVPVGGLWIFFRTIHSHDTGLNSVPSYQYCQKSQSQTSKCWTLCNGTWFILLYFTLFISKHFTWQWKILVQNVKYICTNAKNILPSLHI